MRDLVRACSAAMQDAAGASAIAVLSARHGHIIRPPALDPRPSPVAGRAALRARRPADRLRRVDRQHRARRTATGSARAADAGAGPRLVSRSGRRGDPGLRGVATICAITLVAEIGDFHRFVTPRQLMARLGLVPRERCPGRRTARGAITKAGNGQARRMLVESAWTYRLPARIGRDLLDRSQALARGHPGDRLEGPGPPVGATPHAAPAARSTSSPSPSPASSPPSSGRSRPGGTPPTAS